MSRARPAPRALARSLPRLGRAAAIALAVAAVGVFHVWSRTRVVSAGYALGELQKEHVKLTSEQDRLRIEVETLRSPAALERYARTRLGMAPPAPGAVRRRARDSPWRAGAGRAWTGWSLDPVRRSQPVSLPRPRRRRSPVRRAGAARRIRRAAAAGIAAAPGVRLALRGPLRSDDAPPGR